MANKRRKVARTRLGVYLSSQVLQYHGRFYHDALASLMIERITNSRAPSLCGHYSASSLLRTHPSPSHLRPPSRCFRLYGLLCSGHFSPGCGGLLQLLSSPLSPCRRYHPAGGIRRFSSYALNPAVFASDPEARPPGLLFRGYLTFAFATAW